MKRNRGSIGPKPIPLPAATGGVFELHEAYSHSRASEWPKSVHVISVTPSTYTPNEGTAFTVNVVLSGATTGQTLYYSIVGVSGTVTAADFVDATLTGSFTVSSETAGSFTKICVAGDGTEPGESFVIEIRNQSSSGPLLATSSVITPTDVTMLYAFTSFTFTTAGITGRIGPTLAQCLASYDTTNYPWLSNSSFFTVDASNPGYQLWTVPTAGTYRFVVTGASGGSGIYKGAAARVTADLYLSSGEKLWICCGQISKTYTETGDGGSFVASSNNGNIAGSTALLVAGGAGDYSFYSSEGYTAVGQGFADARTTEGIDVNVLAPWSGSAYTPVTPTPGNGGTITGGGAGSGGGGFFTDGSRYPTNYFGQGQSFFSGLRGGMYQATTYNTTTTAGAGFGGGGARNGGYGTGGGGGYTGGVFAGNASFMSPFPTYSRRATGGSSYAVASATNVSKVLASAGAPSATVVHGSVSVTKL